MLKNLFSKSRRALSQIKNTIAFTPAVLSTLGIALAIFMVYAEEQGVSKYLLQYVPQLVIDNTDTSKTILSTCISGIISIMVFSFSMVMILLNQASSNFSPRLLPGLISNRRHQFILGIYMATILYSIFILISIQPTDNNYLPPGFAVLISIVLMTTSLGAFIYFIHSISQEIQVSTIMENIFYEASSRMKYLIKKEGQGQYSFDDTSKWHEYTSNSAGYLGHVEYDRIAAIAKEKETRIVIIPSKGSLVLENMSIFKSERKIEDPVAEEISSLFTFSIDEMVEDNYPFAFKQINEIALKAMSPGINDPGTAKSAIDYLTQLFILRLQKKDSSFYTIDDTPYVEITTANLSDLLYETLAGLRTYCKHDVLIMRQLYNMLVYLRDEAIKVEDHYQACIDREIDNVKHAVNDSIEYEVDYDKIVTRS